MLEEMAAVVYANDRHEHVLRRLLDEVNATMSIYHVWGSHLGSAHLFRQHLDSRRRITEIVEKTQVSHRYGSPLGCVNPHSLQGDNEEG